MTGDGSKSLRTHLRLPRQQPVLPMSPTPEAKQATAKPSPQATKNATSVESGKVPGLIGPLEDFQRRDGYIWKARRVDDEWQDTKVCRDFHVVAQTRDEAGESWGREIEFKDNDGNRRTFVILNKHLAGDGSELRKELTDVGFWIGTGTAERNAFATLVNNYRSDRRVTTVSKPGWFGDFEKRRFITPLGHVIKRDGCSDDVIYRLMDGRGAADRERNGWDDRWLEEVAHATQRRETPHFVLGLLSGCAGTVLQLIDEPSCGLHFSGDSSLGKSTAQIIGASCWANPAPDKGVLVNTRTTDNAIEFLFSRGNGASLHFDEAKTGNDRVIAQIPFLLAGESGKARMSANGNARRVATWRTFVTMSSEKGLRHHIERAGDQLLTGGTVRFVNVDVSSLPPIDSREAKAIKDAALANYGHGGPMFVRTLFKFGYVNDPELLKRMVDDFQGRLIKQGSSTPATERAARVFATLWAVGEIMVKADILLDGCAEQAVMWGWQNFLASEEAASLRSKDQSVEKLFLWLRSNPGKVRRIGDITAPNEVVAWYDGDTVYIPRDNLSKIPGMTTSSRGLIQELKKRRLLIPLSPKNLQHEFIPKVGRFSNYRIKLQIDVTANTESELNGIEATHGEANPFASFLQ